MFGCAPAPFLPVMEGFIVAFYKVKSGSARYKGKTYFARDPNNCIFEYDGDDLCKKQPNHFELLIDPATISKKLADPIQAPEQEAAVATATDLDEVGETEAEEDKNEEKSLGKDVTSNYPDAVGSDLLVFERRRGRVKRFFVATEEEPHNELNEAPLTNSGLVEFLEGYEG